MNAHARAGLRVAIGLVLAPIVALVVAAVMTPLPPELDAEDGYSASVRFMDRDGALLREVRADDSSRARWIPLAEIGPSATRAILAAEDARFRLHPGVDPIAVARAALDDVTHAHVVSGASTITMQLARVVRPHRRTLLGKFGEMALALRIEASLSKDRILEEYANRAPFGPNLRGIDAASRFYFDKPPSALSTAEAATLAAIPRGPDLYAPTKHAPLVLKRRDRVLARMTERGWLSADERARAEHEPLALHLSRATFGAPHLVQALSAGAIDPRVAAIHGSGATVTTTIDRVLQAAAEEAARTTIAPLASRHVTSASVVVLDNASGEILAYVGSPSFFDESRAGQNDGVRAKRQPGSTLKPFVYALAMERLGFTPATILPDVELHLETPRGVYSPLDYDEHFHGPVRLREALGSSLNVPAVWTLDRVGVAPVLDRLHDLGMTSLDEPAEHYGPALAVGDGEVTLLELANAYATLARDGVWRPVRALRDVEIKGGSRAVASEEPERRVVPAAVASVITDILADKEARVAAFGERSALELSFPVAAKTGTSKGYRDNWTIGYTREVTVAVWVGNFDGTPMEGVSGITGAAPLFHAVMESAMRGREPLPFAVDRSFVRTSVCPLSGGAPTDACTHAIEEWMPAGAPIETCTMHESSNGHVFERFPPEYAAWARAAGRETAPSTVHADAHRVSIAWPADGSTFLVEPDRSKASQALSVRVLAPRGTPRVVLRVDGRVASVTGDPYVARWPLDPGEHVLVAEAPGLPASSPVRVRVE